MNALIRYLTSFFATICHIFSGLSVIAATLWFVPAIAYFLPSVVIGLGDAIGISLTQFVTDVQSSAVFTTVTLLASFVAFVVNFVLLKVLGDKLYAIGRPTPTRQAASQQAASAGEQSTATQQAGPGTKDYRREFRNMSYVMSGFMGLLFVAFVLFFDPATIPETVIGGGDSIATLFAGLAVIYGVMGYGAQRGSLEAVIVGTLVFAINFISGLVSLNTLGILVGGFGSYYGIRALLSGDLDLIVVEELRTRHASRQQASRGNQPQSNYGSGAAGQGRNAGQGGPAGQGGTQPQGGNAYVEQPAQQQASDPMETQKVAPAERDQQSEPGGQQPDPGGQQGETPSQQVDDESGPESQQTDAGNGDSGQTDDQRADE